MDRIQILLGAAALALTLGAGPSVAQSSATPPAPTRPAAGGPQVHAFTVGAVQVVAVRDGGPMLLPQPSFPLPWADTAAVAAAQQAAGRPADQVQLSIQPLLVRDGQRVILIDSGAGGTMGPSHLVASLQAAGVTPDQVTDVLISHAHGDHIGGLVTGGRLTFPNATIRMTTAEWADLRATAGRANAQPLVAAITSKVQTFEPGARISPAIVAVPLLGHTPGHTGYRIGEGADALLYIGDAMHSDVVSVRRPDLAINFDADGPTAANTRREILTRAAAENQRIFAVHFPFPGVGRIRREGEGFVWVPEPN